MKMRWLAGTKPCVWDKNRGSLIKMDNHCHAFALKYPHYLCGGEKRLYDQYGNF